MQLTEKAADRAVYLLLGVLLTLAVQPGPRGGLESAASAGEDKGLERRLLRLERELSGASMEMGGEAGCPTSFMAGFQSIRKGECLALLSQKIQLDTAAKQAAGALLVFAVGFANSGLLWARRRRRGKATPDDQSRWKSRLAGCSLYILQLSISYLLMLAVMSYWFGFFFAAVLGQAAGHLLLFDDAEAAVEGDMCHSEGAAEGLTPPRVVF